MCVRFRVCFALKTTKLLSHRDTLIHLKPEQRTVLGANVHFKQQTKLRILGHARNIVFIAHRLVRRFYRLSKHGVVRFFEIPPEYVRRNNIIFVLAIGDLKDTKRLETELTWLKAYFVYEQRNFC